MSYCRWSSDNHRSDVYAYDAESGVCVHVASRRIVFPPDMPTQPNLTDHSPEEWVRLHRQWQERFDQCPTVPIGLPRDGHNIYGLGYGEAAGLLSRLADMGYRVPAGAIEALREEQAECVEVGR